MKKILYTLLSVSLFVASCTKEVPVTGEHDVSAEVSPAVTTEYKTLLCNLKDVTSLNIEAAMTYVDSKLANEVELTLLLVPAADMARVESYCAEKEYLLSKVVTGKVATCAIAKDSLVEMGVVQNSALELAALFVEYKGDYYIVSSLVEGTTEALCAQRTEQVKYLIAETIDKPELASNAPWIWALNMNALSEIDVTKYGLPYMDAEYDAETGITSELYAWQFASHSPLLYNNFVDCVAAQYSNYPYADGEWRYDFIYSSPKAWQKMQPMTIDYDASFANKIQAQEDEEGEGEGEGDDEDPIVITPIKPGTLAVYPIIITLKSEEK